MKGNNSFFWDTFVKRWLGAILHPMSLLFTGIGGAAVLLIFGAAIILPWTLIAWITGVPSYGDWENANGPFIDRMLMILWVVMSSSLAYRAGRTG